MIYVGLDDTDTLETSGTNKVARALVAELAGRYRCPLILRHQLLQDPRVPFTSHNSSASILLEPNGDPDISELIGRIKTFMRQRFVVGSDPGLCVTVEVPEALTAFGQRCKTEVVRQQSARELAAQYGTYLEGLGGTNDGVIGALAAVGLAVDGNDGRVVHLDSVSDDVSGSQDVQTLRRFGVDVLCFKTGNLVLDGRVDVGKRLRPNYRQHRVVLFADRALAEACEPASWSAVRLT
jgi:hypothetical protein